MTPTKLENLRLEKITKERNAETRKGLSLFYNTDMEINYFLDNKLDCKRDNPLFVKYLNGLKDLFLGSQKLIDGDNLDEAKNLLMGSIGNFSPNLYKVSEEINNIFLGELRNQTIEIYLNYRKLYEELSGESVNDLTGGDINISNNRIKLFLVQELRLISSL